MIYNIEYPGNGNQFEMFRYPSGELQVRLRKECFDNIKFSDVIITATILNGETMGLALLNNAVRAVVGRWAKVTLILPYLPYSRADRRFVPGDCFGLEVFTEAINSMKFYKVVTLDAHSKVPNNMINWYTNVSPDPIIKAVISEIGDLTVLLPDEGSKTRYSFNNVSVLNATKKRDSKTGKLSGFAVPPAGAFTTKKVLIVDDICDGGGTFLGIAAAMAQYDVELYLYVTHGIFSRGLEELSAAFKHIYTTTSLVEWKSTKQERKDLTIISCYGTILASIVSPKELWGNAVKQEVK